MDKNFKVRVTVGLSMFIVAVVALYTFDSIPFKIIYTIFSIVAIVELFSFFKRKYDAKNVLLAIIELLFIGGGISFVIQNDLVRFGILFSAFATCR